MGRRTRNPPKGCAPLLRLHRTHQRTRSRRSAWPNRIPALGGRRSQWLSENQPPVRIWTTTPRPRAAGDMHGFSSACCVIEQHRRLCQQCFARPSRYPQSAVRLHRSPVRSPTSVRSWRRASTFGLVGACCSTAFPSRGRLLPALPAVAHVAGSQGGCRAGFPATRSSLRMVRQVPGATVSPEVGKPVPAANPPRPARRTAGRCPQVRRPAGVRRARARYPDPVRMWCAGAPDAIAAHGPIQTVKAGTPGPARCAGPAGRL